MGAKTTTVDFSGVKDRGDHNPKQVAEGDYAAVITDVKDGKSKKDDGFQYVFTIKLKKYSQYSYPYYCKVQDNQLWKLRNIAVAAGLNVPKKRQKFDPNRVVGKSVGVTMVDDEPYQGRVKSTIDAIFPISELADGPEMDDDDETTQEEFDEGGPQLAGGDDFDPEDEAESKPKKKKGKKAKAEEPAAEEPKGKKKKKKGGKIEEMDISDV